MIPNSESQYGVVKRMREIRDELGEKIMHMTWEEQKAFFREKTISWHPNFYDEIDKQKEKNN